MKIAIIGPGALGGLLGALLFEAGEEVTLVDYLPARAARLSRQGLRLRTPAGEERKIPVPIGLPGEAGPAELIIVAVKAHQTGAAALSLRPLMAESGLALS
ncbi:MAG: ketopantoate reductase family protein, partial [Desulfobaccales bacterium]